MLCQILHLINYTFPFNMKHLNNHTRLYSEIIELQPNHKVTQNPILQKHPHPHYIQFHDNITRLY